jgi:hypothetical protein
MYVSYVDPMLVNATVALLEAVTELIKVTAPALGVIQLGALAPLDFKT